MMFTNTTSLYFKVVVANMTYSTLSFLNILIFVIYHKNYTAPIKKSNVINIKES